MRQFNLISAPFCSGISWMVSVLLELGIRTSHYAPKWYPHGFWEPVPGSPDREKIVPAGERHMRFYVPRLQFQNEFQLEPGIEVTWEHRLDFARQLVPTILFVRDPRDAIHSLYVRNYHPFPWLDYLRRPEDWRDHFPEMFSLPPADTWAIWHAMWVGLGALTPTLVLRFEDSRTDPAGVVQQALKFLGVTRSLAEIQSAIANSTFEKTKASMERVEKETGEVFRVARRGKVGEWEEVFDDSAQATFGGPAAEWMHRFGYRVLPAASEAWHAEPASDPQIKPGAQHDVRLRDLHDAGRFLSSLPQMLAAAGGNEAARLEVGIEWVSVDWTLKVLGPTGAASPAGNCILKTFREFNRRYRNWAPVRSRIEGAIRGIAPVNTEAFGRLDGMRSITSKSKPATTPLPATPPALIEENYNGYDLYGHRARFYAVSRSAGPFDWSALSEVELTRLSKVGTVLSADLSFELKEAIDARKRP